MASYHCTVKTGGKGRGGTHAEYIMREGKYSPELTRGTSKLEDMEHTTSGNMPAWAKHDATVFWRAADEHERANGATYREIEVALPREMTPEQRKELVEDFIKQQLGDKHAYTYAIHIPKASIEKGEQPHAHIMYSERTLDGIARDPELFFKRANSKNPEKGGCKKDSAGTQERLLATRELWAEVQNKHLEKVGSVERVTHLSLKAQGIDRQAEKHLGPQDAKKIDAAALMEHRAAGRELEQVRHRVAAIDTAAELAAQAQAAEAIRQAQASAAAAEQARAAERARAQAAAAAAEEQARQAEREAADQAQAEREAAAARQAAEIQIRLTAEAEEKEDDRIRAAALGALKKSSAATDRAGAFAVTDHSGIADHLQAAGRASHSNRGSIESSRGHLVASAEAANERDRAAPGAIKGAERRVFRENIDRSAPAVKQQLGTVDRVVQQAVEFFPAVVRAIAAAAKAVTQQLHKTPAKAPERPAAAPAPTAKAISAPAPAKPLAAVSEPALTEADRKLIARVDDAIDQAARGDPAAMKALPALVNKMDEARREATSTHHRAIPLDFTPTGASQDAYQARQVAAKLDVNAQAAARRAGAVPYPPGLEGQWATDHHSSYETAHKKAVSEATHHAREPRPEGFFKKKETAAYDAKTADLQSKVQGWEKEIGWRGQALKAASEARKPMDAEYIARAREAHRKAQEPQAAKAAPLAARSAAMQREKTRLEEKLRGAFDREKKQEFERQRERGMGRGI